MFEIRDLSILNYARGFTLWHYKSQESLETNLQIGFFQNAEDMFVVGDMILISTPTQGAQRFIASVSPVTLEPLA